MLTETQRNLIDKAARIRGVNEHAFCAEAEEQRRNPVDLAREVIAEAEQESAPVALRAPQPKAAAKPSTPASLKQQASNLSSLIEGWATKWERCAEADDIEGLHELACAAKDHIRDPALYVLAVSLSTIHRIKRERLEARLAALENRKGFTYCGTWDADTDYELDDFVTFQGSLWHTDTRTRGVRPGSGQDNPWQLVCKRGRDAR